MIRLDPKIIDQETIRKNRRKQLLKTALAPIIILFLASILLLKQGFYNIASRISSQNGNYAIIGILSEQQKFINLAESYIASYNQGVSNLKLSKFTEAEENFEETLKQLPPEDKLCKIYINLSYSIEQQADMKASENNYEKAIELYNKAESTLYNNNCVDQKDSAKSKDKAGDRAKGRIDKKRTQSAELMNGNKTQSSGQQTGTGEEISSGQLQDLLDKNQATAEKQQELRNRTGGGYGSASIDTGYHW